MRSADSNTQQTRAQNDAQCSEEFAHQTLGSTSSNPPARLYKAPYAFERRSGGQRISESSVLRLGGEVAFIRTYNISRGHYLVGDHFSRTPSYAVEESVKNVAGLAMRRRLRQHQPSFFEQEGDKRSP